MHATHKRHCNHVMIGVALLWATCYGFPTGPPDDDSDVCTTLLPRHEAPPQTSPSPYVITTSATTYQPGSVITVTIENTSGRNFRGFYIQARLANDPTLIVDEQLQMLSGRALGEFISPQFGTKLHSCTEGVNNAISHSINTDKSRITVSWRAPSRPEPWIDSNRFPVPWIGPIQFVATVVETPREMFWAEIYSDIICEGEDIRPPTIVGCPDDITSSGPGPVFWNQPTVMENYCDAVAEDAVTIRFTHTPGQIFPPGLTQVRYTYTDTRGNENTCTFNVNVMSTEAIECASMPCLNGGACIEGINQYACLCLSGWTGARCETFADTFGCSGRQCFNGGECVDGLNQDSSVCLCLPGWSGVNCDFREGDQCATRPCQNDAQCVDGNNQYTCVCQPGWTGINCEINVNECESSACQNGAQCIDKIDAFECFCLPGYTGIFCQIVDNSDGDQCASRPCHNAGRCLDGNNQYTCVCQPGWTGINCEININECASSPCRNGGVCIDFLDDFECLCRSGYTGIFCQIVDNSDGNQCASRPCQNAGRCVDGNNQYTCVCQPGWTGINCEINIDECASFPCLNGGQCFDGLNAFACECLAGYTGVTCEIDIDECASFPCLNGGQCFDGLNAFTCECIPGYSGSICEIDISACASNPCQNGGRCTEGIGDYACFCLPEFTGPNCEIPIFSACASQPCNFGVCFDAVGGDYECTCQDGYTGRNCDVLSLQGCASQPCIYGRCFNTPDGGYTCVCVDGYSGDNCENDGAEYIFAFVSCNKDDVREVLSPGAGVVSVTWIEPAVIGNPGGVFLAAQTHVPGYFFPVGVTRVSYTFSDGTNTAECAFNVIITESACVSGPCRNQGTCEDIDGGLGYICLCLEEFTGTDCERGRCTPISCMNGGSCFEQFAGIICACPQGYEGDRCERVAPISQGDPCLSQPCLNGGQCMTSGDVASGYVCFCSPEFTGPRCNQGTGFTVSCQNNPCLNNGVCVDLPGPEDVCNCQPGFFGEFCQDDACFSQPCQNGGTCTVQGFSLICRCLPGFAGQLCENDFIPPAIQCPLDISRTIDALLGGTTITWSEPVVEDNSGTAFIVSQSHRSGATFGIGTTTVVMYQFSDNAQNVASCQFAVTVEPRRPGPDPCASSPCLNGATCRVFLSNDFYCNCTRGFTGVRCEKREMTLVLNSTQMREFEGNYDQLLGDLPMEDGIVSEEALSTPNNYGKDVVPELTQAQEDQIMGEYGDIFFDQQDILDDVLRESRRKRRQTVSDKVCPLRFVNETKLVSISGSDRNNPREQAQLVQLNKRVQWAFNVECEQQFCQHVGVLDFDQTECICEKQEHIVTALVYNIKIARDTGNRQLPIQLKTIKIYTCGATISSKIRL